MESLFSWLNVDRIGGLASITGLGFTIYVFLGVRKIKQEFLFRARLPSLLKKIQNHASTISSELTNLPDSSHAIIEELAIAQVNIRSLENKSSGTMRLSLKKLRLIIEEIRENQSIDKNSIRAVYLEMNMVIQEISNIREDDKWSQGNG
ncbi:MAG: hypothetical protein WD071_16765 [Pseudohongiella sp.]|uniref:hypothetical protein n=1 Tax=Pseudohongiella sp. TaxID=1979412 RepID=UPI0034A076DF